MKGDDLIERIKRKLAKKSDAEITDSKVAEYLGITPTAVKDWRKRKKVTPRQVESLILKFEKSTMKRVEHETIKTVVEFFNLSPTSSKGGNNSEIFSVKDENGHEHPYLKGLRDELNASHGIYIFYDSRGRALYAGKARDQSLWKELNNAYNRDRSMQTIRRVDHPERRQRFRTSDEKQRQIRARNVALDQLAEYFSAYSVSYNMINSLESLLIRGFANDLLNIRMENFAKLNKKKQKVRYRSK